MKLTGFLFFLIIATNFCSAQAPDTLWTRTYGGTMVDECSSVQQTTDGGYIVAAWTYSFGAGGCDLWLLKTDASGDTLWTRTYGGVIGDDGRSVQQTADGGYIVAGGTESFGAGGWDLWLLKTDDSGDTLWTRTYGGTGHDYGFSVQQTAGSGYIVAGYTYSFGAGDRDLWLLKTDASGDTLWTRTYGGTDWDCGLSVQQTTDGGYIVAGPTYSFGAGGRDLWLLKTDASGDTLWTNTYGGTGYDGGLSVQQTADGGYMVAGRTESFGAGGLDLWLLKTDACGDTLWTRTYGGTGRDEGFSVQQTSDGGYIVAGPTYSFGAGGCDLWLLKTDASGDTLWTNTYGGTGYDGGFSVQQTADGGYIVAGSTESFGAGSYDVYLIRFASASGSICASVNIAGDPVSPAQGITVTVLDENNDPVGDPLQTDENGESLFDSILVGQYSVMIVTPLGYSVSPSETQTDIAVIGGECTTVDFVLSPTIITNDCRTIGYWKHQFNVFTSGRGNAHETSADLDAYLDIVHQHFDVLGVYVDLENFDFEDAKNVLTVRGGSLMFERANQQLFALLLNFASGRVGNETVVSDDGQVAAEAVTLARDLINDADPTNDETAKTVCDQINNGLMIEAGIIPESPIRYKLELDCMARTFTLSQNHPNPFNAQTTIEYSLPEAGHVTIEFYNLLGQRVVTLFKGAQQAGEHSITWDATDFPSGVYFYRIEAGEFAETRKMLLLK